MEKTTKASNEFNGTAEKFVNDTEANKYLKANYREPWVVPDQV